MCLLSVMNTFIIKFMSFIWYINIQVTSSSKTSGRVDIQLRNNVILEIYIYIYVYIYIYTGWRGTD